MDAGKTLGDAREMVRMVTGWCLDQDDLVGFSVGIGETPWHPAVRVTMEWPNGWRSMKEYAIRPEMPPRAYVVAPLDALAREARARAARIADPGRLPG